MKIPEGNFEAYIFDCDGTLADTMPLHYRAWCAALAKYSCEFPEPLFYQLGGVPTVRIIEILNERYGLSMPPEQAAREKEALFMELLPEVQPVEMVVEIVRQVHGKLPLAVASGGHREVVQSTLRAIGILDRFETVVGVEDYANGKPAPDPYLEAARRLKVAPERCLVFEDTETGIASATAAGMQSVLVPSRRVATPAPPPPQRGPGSILPAT